MGKYKVFTYSLHINIEFDIGTACSEGSDPYSAVIDFLADNPGVITDEIDYQARYNDGAESIEDVYETDDPDELFDQCAFVVTDGGVSIQPDELEEIEEEM